MSHLEKRWSAERVDKLAVLIMRARWAADQAPPTGWEKVGMIGAWAELLTEIPDELLEEFYLRAGRAKTNSFPVNALDIIAAWNDAAWERERETKRQMARQQEEEYREADRQIAEERAARVARGEDPYPKIVLPKFKSVGDEL